MKTDKTNKRKHSLVKKRKYFMYFLSLYIPVSVKNVTKQHQVKSKMLCAMAFKMDLDDGATEIGCMFHIKYSLNSE